MYNLLTDPVITVQMEEGNLKASLPEVLALCVQDAVDDFPHLRRFQEHPWHAFMVQAGAMAMIHGGTPEPPTEAEAWRRMLQDLTDEEFPEGEPWQLVVDDLTKPGFLQPPKGPDTPAKQYQYWSDTPDTIDLTVGSKHHEVKEGAVSSAEPEHWIFALVSRQTSGGFDGNRLYGVSRMNSGTGSRHCFSITGSTRFGAHARRDMTILAREHMGQKVNHLLLWTRPWDGKADEAIDMNELEPKAIYIEVSRRARLEVTNEGKIFIRRATSEAPRINHKPHRGMSDDPWTLTQADKAVTISEFGFNARQITRYLDPKANTPPLMCQHDPEVDGEGTNVPDRKGDQTHPRENPGIPRAGHTARRPHGGNARRRRPATRAGATRPRKNRRHRGRQQGPVLRHKKLPGHGNPHTHEGMDRPFGIPVRPGLLAGAPEGTGGRRPGGGTGPVGP